MESLQQIENNQPSLLPQDAFMGPAQVNIDYIKISNSRGLGGLDIGASVMEVEINQGLTTPFIHGKLTISDMHNMKNVFPIIGDEILEISFTVPGSEPIVKTFYTREVSMENETPAKNQLIYFLYFSSKILHNNIREKICIPFKKTKKSAMVKKIYDDYLKKDLDLPIRITETEDICNFIVPYVSPLEAIDMLSKISSYEGHYDFAFYEDLEKYNFVSLSTMKENPEKFYFTTSDNPDFRGETPIGYPSLELMREKILHYTISGKRNNMSTNAVMGIYGGTNLNFDMTNKKINKVIHSYAKKYPDEKHIEQAPPIPLTLNEDLSSRNMAHITVSNEPSFTYGNSEKPLGLAKASYGRKMVNNILFQTVTMEINGRTSIYPGDIVYLDIRKHDVGVTINPETIDPVNSGRYMAINVVHYIRKDGTFNTSMLVGRDSLPNPVPSQTDFNTEIV